MLKDHPSTHNHFSLLFISLALLLSMLSFTNPIADNDYGLHLRIGQEIAETLRPVLVDNHSYTLPQAAYLDHEWLLQLVLYKLWQVFGDGGLVAIKALLLGATLWLLLLTVPGQTSQKMLAMLLVLVLGWEYAQVRPYLFVWLFAAWLNWLLARHRYIAVAGLLILWSNCHASAPLGALVAILHLLSTSAPWPKRLWVSLAYALAVVVNPNGFALYTLFFQIQSHVGFIGEWKPYPPTHFAFWALGLLGTMVFYAWQQKKPYDPYGLLLIVALLFLSFSSSRNAVLAAILLAPYLGQLPLTAFRFGNPKLEKIFTLASFVIFFLFFLSRVWAGQVLQFRLDHERLPVAAAQFIQRHALTGRMFNDYNFGGYFLWKLWPEHKVFLDGRTEVYKGQVLQDYLTASQAQPGWEAIVEQYQVTFFVLRPERFLAQALLQHKAWDLVYFDYNSVVYVRHDLYPRLKRLYLATPYGYREHQLVARAQAEIRYLLQENPRFFGGYKILAFLLYRQGDYSGSRLALYQYLKLHPRGYWDRECRQLQHALFHRP